MQRGGFGAGPVVAITGRGQHLRAKHRRHRTRPSIITFGCGKVGGVGFLRSSPKRSVSARAQLTTHHDIGGASIRQDGIGQSSSLHTTFHLRVAPVNGEPEFDSQMSVWGNDGNHLQPGRWTYVQYDPDHPDRCELDKDRLAKEFDPLYDGRRRVMVPKDVSDAWFKSTDAHADAPASEPTGLVADLARLADLRAAGTLSEAEFAEAKARLLGQGNPE